MQLAVHVLVIDDDEDDFFITSEYIRTISSMNTHITWCGKVKDAARLLASNQFDICFLDYRLGAINGIDLLREAILAGCVKPVVLFTGTRSAEIDLQAVNIGAYDFLVKSEINSEKIERCIRYSLERYKSYTAVKASEQKMRHIFENAQSLIFTCSTEWIIEQCNPASLSITGWSSDELKGKPLSVLFREDEWRQFLLQISAVNAVHEFTITVKQKESDDLRVSSMLLSRMGNEQDGFYWQGIMHDETLRISAEEDRLKAEKLEATYRIVRVLAHEIRNPLTNIVLSTEALSAVGVDEQESYLKIVERSTQRINNILTELLDAARAIDLKLTQTDVKLLLQDVVALVKDRAVLKNVKITLSMCESPIIKRLDSEKMKIALLNLMLNAIEAADKANNTLDIILTTQHTKVLLSIIDNGCGINEDNKRKLFEPYFTTKMNGMGLGLMATLNIIKSHQATIDVQSKLNEGTTFRILLP